MSMGLKEPECHPLAWKVFRESEGMTGHDLRRLNDLLWEYERPAAPISLPTIVTDLDRLLHRGLQYGPGKLDVEDWLTIRELWRKVRARIECLERAVA